jgi:membrane protease YdiL (CAAX protease family)
MQAHTQQIATEIINSTGAQFWIGAMTAVVGAPLFEELIFRVFLYSNLRKAMGISLAMFFSAFLFALMHANLFAFFPIFLLGLFFAILYEKTQSLLIPALAHATHNGLTLAYLCFSFR